MPESQTQAHEVIVKLVRELVAEKGVVKAAKRLGISRESTMRVAAGLGRPHSVAACGLALGVIGVVEQAPAGHE